MHTARKRCIKEFTLGGAGTVCDANVTSARSPPTSVGKRQKHAMSLTDVTADENDKMSFIIAATIAEDSVLLESLFFDVLFRHDCSVLVNRQTMEYWPFGRSAGAMNHPACHVFPVAHLWFGNKYPSTHSADSSGGSDPTGGCGQNKGRAAPPVTHAGTQFRQIFQLHHIPNCCAKKKTTPTTLPWQWLGQTRSLRETCSYSS